jgi:hypothetical protein
VYQFIVKEKAILMAKNAYDWYEAQLIGLGDDFY